MRSNGRAFQQGTQGNTIRFNYPKSPSVPSASSVLKSELTTDSKMTRQAITKHLRVLEAAGLVRAETAGRERRFELEPKPLGEASAYLDLVSSQWEEALTRLKKFVET